MNPTLQEKIAGLVVALVAGRLLYRVIKRQIVPDIAGWLLRRGRVGLAMRLKKWSMPKDCC